MMELIKYPNTKEWKQLCTRPEMQSDRISKSVLEIIEMVKSGGDQSLFQLTKKLDKADLSFLEVAETELVNAQIDPELAEAIDRAKENIEIFHRSQAAEENLIETTIGVKCWRKNIAIEKIGLYIPGGSAPLFSTVLMLGIPALIAGCKEIILCTPPDSEGQISPVILYTANLLGIKKIFKVGGAQAIAAMAYGTESIPQVFKIFGPGNQFVTKAKEVVQLDGIAIDMPAGPSELLVIADDSCIPKFVAADLLSQAEHGIDSQTILLSDSKAVIDAVNGEIQVQLDRLPRKEIAEKALQNSKAMLLNELEECMAFSNLYAPEHLILVTKKNSQLIEQLRSAGSVFIGNYSCESAGDYGSGTNHTLPTNGFSKAYSGLSLDSFVKKVTFQELSEEGLQNIGPAIERMAAAEQLLGHKNAVSIRLNSMNDV